MNSLIAIQKNQSDGIATVMQAQAETIRAVEYLQGQAVTARKLSLSQYESWHAINEANYRASRAIHIFLCITVMLLLTIILFTR
jgi:hypothetical protein